MIKEGKICHNGGVYHLAKLEWYFEYEIQVNRPMLGDISSLLGMLSINIVTINGVDLSRRECCSDAGI